MTEPKQWNSGTGMHTLHARDSWTARQAGQAARQSTNKVHWACQAHSATLPGQIWCDSSSQWHTAQLHLPRPALLAAALPVCFGVAAGGAHQQSVVEDAMVRQGGGFGKASGACSSCGSSDGSTARAAEAGGQRRRWGQAVGASITMMILVLMVQTMLEAVMASPITKTF